ncbi:MAG: hypothetical protein Alpg2KO_28970 [Alphaproteobacteria bacterium]
MLGKGQGRQEQVASDAIQSGTDEYSTPVAYVMWLLAGLLFMHRLYLGHYLSGLIGLILGGATAFSIYALFNMALPVQQEILVMYASFYLPVILIPWLVGDLLVLKSLVKAANNPDERLESDGALSAHYQRKLEEQGQSFTRRHMAQLHGWAAHFGWMGLHRLRSGRKKTGSLQVILAIGLLFTIYMITLQIVGTKFGPTSTMRVLAAPVTLVSMAPFVSMILMAVMSGASLLWWGIDAIRLTIESSRATPDLSVPQQTVAGYQSRSLARSGGRDAAAEALARSQVQTNAASARPANPAGGYAPQGKSAGTAYALWLMFGLFGGHHFYLGMVKRGSLRLLLSAGSIGFGAALLIMRHPERFVAKGFWLCFTGIAILLIVDLVRIPTYTKLVNAVGGDNIDAWN